MFKMINKYRVCILWTLSLTIFLCGTIIAQFKPFTEKGSGILMWFSFNSALLAIIFSAIKKKNKYKIISCIIAMIYITIKVILRFI